MTEPACSAHAALVERAMGPDPSDADLQAYADEVPGCPDCRRALALASGVHPGRADTAPDGEWQRIQTVVALDDAAVDSLIRALDEEPSAWRRWAMPAAAALLVGSLGLWAASDGPVAVTPPEAPVIAGVSTGPDVRAERREIDLRELLGAPVPSSPDARSGLEEDLEDDGSDGDAVAMDWPAPPFEDLRGASIKAAAPRMRTLSFVLDGTIAVGEAAVVSVEASHTEAVTLCVSGAENGVVWRGGVPEGRTVLTRSGREVRYRFPASGTYGFTLRRGDDPTCTAAVIQRVEVAL